MERPGELLRRARESRGSAPVAHARPQTAEHEPDFAQPWPANRRPDFARAAHSREGADLVQARPEAEDRPSRPANRPGAELQAHHGAYSALMRSHDRMRTCHLPVQGGGNRA